MPDLNRLKTHSKVVESQLPLFLSVDAGNHVHSERFLRLMSPKNPKYPFQTHLMYSRAQSSLLLPIQCPPMLLVSPLTCLVLSDGTVAAVMVVTGHGTISDLMGRLLKGDPCHLAPVGLWVRSAVTCVSDDISSSSMVVCDDCASRYVFLQQTGSWYSHPVCAFFMQEKCSLIPILLSPPIFCMQ